MWRAAFSVVLLFVGANAVMEEDKKAKTWTQLGTCMGKTLNTCLQKYPDTPKNITRCFTNKTINAAWVKYGKKFVACVDKHLHTGQSCIMVKHHHHHVVELTQEEAHKRYPFFKCLVKGDKQCVKGCIPVRGRKARTAGRCYFHTMKYPIHLFWRCMHRRGEEDAPITESSEIYDDETISTEYY